MSALKGSAMSFYSKGSRVQIEYVFVFAFALSSLWAVLVCFVSGIGTILCINNNLEVSK